MKFTDLIEQFPNKQRNLGDLARYIRNRTDDHSNYCLLLGAGCSVTSGIRPASNLIEEWRTEACRDLKMSPLLLAKDDQINFLRQKASTWYDASREYSSLFERRFDLQRQRRVFVESEVAGKIPSIGYAYLTSLVEARYFNTIFTTNFDDLLNEAFYLFSNERPIVCAHDSSINSVTVTSKRPKVIKLHGDYLFDDLKSTVRETESLEQNMRTKLAEFSKDHGLIVVGYSGSDRSIMENLQTLLRNDEYFKSGIYWCIRKDADICDDLKKLLLKDRVYYVEISGFDELFADLYAEFNSDHYIPEAALGINRRSSEALHKLLASPNGVPATTEVLRKARARLEKHTKRTAIADIIARDSEDSKTSLSGSELTDDDLLLLSEVSDLVASEQYEGALQKTRTELLKDHRPEIKRRLMEQSITALLAKNDRAAAIATADEIIRLYPKRASSYMKKSNILLQDADRLAEIMRAIAVDPFAVGPRVALCDAKLRDASLRYGEERHALLDEAIASAQDGIRLDPSAANPAWGRLFDVIEERRLPVKEHAEATQPLIEKLSEQNPYSIRVLELRQRQCATKKDEARRANVETLLADIKIGEERYSDDFRSYARIRLKALRVLEDKTRLMQEISQLKESIDRDPDLAALVASIYRESMGDDESAIRLLRESLRSSQFDWEVLTHLIQALCDVGQVNEAQQYFEKWGSRLGRRTMHQSHMAILEARERFDECLKECVKFGNEIGVRDIAAEVFYLLSTEDSKSAETLLRGVLTPINFTPEAEVEIVNFELARKLNKSKPDKARLEKVLSFTTSNPTRVGAYAVLDDRRALATALREAIEEDRTVRYVIRRWPAMRPHLADPTIAGLLNGGSVPHQLVN